MKNNRRENNTIVDI